MEISPLFFYLFAGIAIGFSLLVILKKSAIASAFSLVVVFFAFAAIYAMMDAHLIAALQVIVYAGAIMVLFLFVIMFLNVDKASFDKGGPRLTLKLAGAGFSAVMLLLFVWAFKNSKPLEPIAAFSPEGVQAAGGNTQVISELMFSEYILPFELTSVLLLAVIVAAVAIAKRKQAGQAGGGK